MRNQTDSLRDQSSIHKIQSDDEREEEGVIQDVALDASTLNHNKNHS